MLPCLIWSSISLTFSLTLFCLFPMTIMLHQHFYSFASWKMPLSFLCQVFAHFVPYSWSIFLRDCHKAGSSLSISAQISPERPFWSTQGNDTYLSSLTTSVFALLSSPYSFVFLYCFWFYCFLSPIDNRLHGCRHFYSFFCG